MAKFRLKMATQLGEKIAAEFGFDAFPIRPHEIAAKKDICVKAKPSDVKGISGAIIFAGDEVTIVYSTEYENRGFENFSLSHELGHYFLPDHPEEILKAGGQHFSKGDFTQNTSIELEADHFASGLLMPGHLAHALLSDAPVGLEGILKLAGAAECSCTAAAIRAAECAAYPIAIIVSSGEDIAYSFLSESFKNLGKLTFLRKGMRLPDTHTLRFNVDRNNVLSARCHTAETTLTEWFDCPRSLALDEEIVGLGTYGYTLTVLSSDFLSEQPSEEDDEDAELERSWTPRFAYGR
nr:ImmA/IrrE family metallo-endopeptidase [Mesorhizobium sp.]